MNVDVLQNQATLTLEEEEEKIRAKKPSGMLERA
jgi:hypothetical protein